MNGVDLCIVAGLLVGGIYGWRAGLLRCLLGLAALVGSVWLALARGGWIGDHFGARLGMSPSTAAWTGAGLILCVSLAGFLLILALLERVLRASALGPFNAIGGGILGLLNGALCLGLALSFLSLHPPHSDLPGHLTASALARPVERISRTLVAGLRRVSPNVEEMLGRMKADQGSVVSRSPEVVEEVSRRAGQVRAEVDTLIARSVGDSSESRAPIPDAKTSPALKDSAKVRRQESKRKAAARDTAGIRPSLTP